MPFQAFLLGILGHNVTGPVSQAVTSRAQASFSIEYHVGAPWHFVGSLWQHRKPLVFMACRNCCSPVVFLLFLGEQDKERM